MEDTIEHFFSGSYLNSVFTDVIYAYLILVFLLTFCWICRHNYNMKCYGRKKNIVVKEKSFITSFFDGDKSSDSSFFHDRSILQADSPSSEKENRSNNILLSPVLFEDSIHKEATKDALSFKENSFTKTVETEHAKKKKPTRVLRNKRIKPMQIQHFSTKYCKSLQPAWSEFYEHKFTLENVGSNNLYTRGNLKCRTSKCLRSTVTGLHENINKTNVTEGDQARSCTRTSPKNGDIFNSLKNLNHSSLNNSEDLFMENCNRKKIKKKKSVRQQKKNNNSNQTCIVDSTVNMITELNHQSCLQLNNLHHFPAETIPKTKIDEEKENLRVITPEILPLSCLRSTVTGLYEDVNKTNVTERNDARSCTRPSPKNGDIFNSLKNLNDSSCNNSEDLFMVNCNRKKIKKKKNVQQQKKKNSNQTCIVDSSVTMITELNHKSCLPLSNLHHFPAETIPKTKINEENENLTAIMPEILPSIMIASHKEPTKADGSLEIAVIQDAEISSKKSNLSGTALKSQEHCDKSSRCVYLQSFENVNAEQSTHYPIKNCNGQENSLSAENSCISDCKQFSNISRECSKDDLIKKNSECKVLHARLSFEQKDCEVFYPNKLNKFEKSNKDFNSKSLGRKVSLLPDNLPRENESQNKKYSESNKKFSFENSKSKQILSSANALMSLENLSSNNNLCYSPGDLTIASVEKKIGSTSSFVDFSPSGINSLQNLISLKRKLPKNFITSTPLIQHKKQNSIAERLESLINDKDIPEKIKTTSISFRNVCQNSIILDPIKQSLQFNESKTSMNPKKSLTVQNKGTSNFMSSERNRSFLNLSSVRASLSTEESDECVKAKLLKVCNQDTVASFADSYNWNCLKVKKIGEGSYGEVFMITNKKVSSVLKIIPIANNSCDNSFQSLLSVLSEVQISLCLSELRDNKRNQSKNFIKVRRVSVVTGSYPSKLIDAWDIFIKERSCYNLRPDVFDDNQMFIILELEYGGKDMSCFVLRNSLEAESILKQVAMSLAIAEEEFLFEHRDLHLGNILVQRNRRKTISYKLKGKDISFECHGLQVTLIDFTLSRLYKDGVMYYYDLADNVSLFEQSGDFQYEVYKSMKRQLENRWHECSLYSNVLWLKYLCQKMKLSKYSRPSTASHKRGLEAIDTFSKLLMTCNSAFECLTKCGITTMAFKKLSLDVDVSKKSILVARNSIQKTKLSVCN